MEVELDCSCENCRSCRQQEDSRIACLSDKDFILEFGKKIWLGFKTNGNNLSKAYANNSEWNQWLDKLKESYELEGNS